MKELGILVLGILFGSCATLFLIFRRRGDNMPAADRLVCRAFAFLERVQAAVKAIDGLVRIYRERRQAFCEVPTCLELSPKRELTEEPTALRIAGGPR